MAATDATPAATSPSTSGEGEQQQQHPHSTAAAAAPEAAAAATSTQSHHPPAAAASSSSSSRGHHKKGGGGVGSFVNLRLILVSGKTKDFQFAPTESAMDIAKYVFDNWPEGEYVFLLGITNILALFWRFSSINSRLLSSICVP